MRYCRRDDATQGESLRNSPPSHLHCLRAASQGQSLVASAGYIHAQNMSDKSRVLFVTSRHMGRVCLSRL